MTFIPRIPLTAAETHVDFVAHNSHIVSQRNLTEQAALPAARRLAVMTTEMHGISPLTAIAALQHALQTRLEQTARFGASNAIAEITALRAGKPVAVRTAWQISDAGKYANVAAGGIESVLRFVARRALETARSVADTAASAAQEAQLDEDASPLAIVLQAVTRSLHNHVLELVGETLNLGRTAGAMSLEQIPEFALRSEQLDKNTCGPCDELHGQIAVVNSPDFYALLPPSGCLGGGRCRGIMVFGDGPQDVRQQELLAA